MIEADEQRLTRAQFERALADLKQEAYGMTLFVSGASDSSSRAITNVRAICDTHLGGRYQLDIVANGQVVGSATLAAATQASTEAGQAAAAGQWYTLTATWTATTSG